MTNTGNDRTIIMDSNTMSKKITRIAHQIYENNFDAKTLYVIGIKNEGAVLAERLHTILTQISDLEITCIALEMDKKNPLTDLPQLNSLKLRNASVILVDDVLNSGKTLMYATKSILDQSPKTIQTVCLVDRKHRKFPVRADFVGLTLSTTLKEHITVKFGKEDMVYME